MAEYQPLTSKEIEQGYYFLTHRKIFIRLALGVMIFLVFIIYAILLFNFIKSLQMSSWQEIANGQQTTNSWSAYHQANQPQDLAVGKPLALATGTNLYNLVVIVKNPNKDWFLSQFDYTFLVNGQALQTKQAFLPTGDQTILSFSGYPSAQNIRDLKVEINNYHWYHRNSQVKPINWEIKNISWQPLSRNTVGEKVVTLPARASWQAKNLSLYDFWQVDWQVVLFANDTLVGVGEITSRDFNSLQTKDLEAIFNYNLPAVSRVEIWPHVNNLDKDNFKKIEADINL